VKNGTKTGIFSEQELEESKSDLIELLDDAETGLLNLDGGADFNSSFDSIFRALHNLKGAAGMLQLERLEAHVHEFETILLSFKGKCSIPKSYISRFLCGIDAARALLNGQNIKFDFQPAVASEVKEPPIIPITDIPESVRAEFVVESLEIIERISAQLQLLEHGDATKETVDGLYRDVHSLKGSACLYSYNKLADLTHAMESSLERIREGSHLPSRKLLDCHYKSLQLIETLMDSIKKKNSDEEHASVIPAMVGDLNTAAEELPETAQGHETRTEEQQNLEEAILKSQDSPEAEGTSSIRVPVSLLDNLMTLMGEMVLVRNQVLQFANRSEDLELLSMGKRLNVVTSDIQGEMMKTRMQPIGTVLNKLSRVVRDLSNELGKTINLQMTGTETELDKSLLEAIKDPLTHIVRNSCDHGIESRAARLASGKPEAGKIEIKSYHEGGQVVIEVFDDGKGRDKKLILNKAVEKGLVSPTQTSRLTEKEIFNLVFAPGFSTAAKVTNVSGRGVGMDVVRTNIERIGGTVDLSSTAGTGTTIRVRIPLTLAIVPALIVKCGQGAKFAIPQVKLEELVRVEQAAAENKVEVLHGAPVFRLRGNILPLVDLNQILKIDGAGHTNYGNGIINIAVVNGEHGSFGLIIDEVQDTADIVVKPLNRLLKSLQVYSGATILGDGSVALILDVPGISKVAQVIQDQQATATPTGATPSDDTPRKHGDAREYLLVHLASPTKHAIALRHVHRLEEFRKSDVEYSHSQPVVRYRDIILPLINANEHFNYPGSEHKGEIIPVVVVKSGQGLFGLVVDAILDTLSTAIDLQPVLVKRNGISGNLNTREELIVVINPLEMISKIFPKASSEITETAWESREPKRPRQTAAGRILLVEDSDLFRNGIKTILEKNGYDVVTADNGKEAFDYLSKGEIPFDLVISDIEMPKLNGYQLAEKIRQTPALSRIPLIAVSSRVERQDVPGVLRAGYDIYLEKLKPEVLVQAAANLIFKAQNLERRAA